MELYMTMIVKQVKTMTNWIDDEFRKIVIAELVFFGSIFVVGFYILVSYLVTKKEVWYQTWKRHMSGHLKGTEVKPLSDKEIHNHEKLATEDMGVVVESDRHQHHHWTS